MNRRRAASILAIAIVAAGSGLAWTSGVVPIGAAAGPSASTKPAVAKTATVARKTLEVTTDLDGTLGYAGSVLVNGGLFGTLTWVPTEGTIMRRGDQLYEVDGSRRATLMYGPKPAWRTLRASITDGDDVMQLETNLVAMGFAPSGMPVDRHWGTATTTAVKAWQKAAGLSVDAVVDLGEVVFLPDAFRVTSAAAIGGQAGQGGAVLEGSSDRRVVAVKLAANRQALLALNTAVTISLPKGTSAAGKVAAVGRVAHAGSGSDISGGSTPTIDVTITLDDPSAAGDLDQAPVKIHIVTDSRTNVLAVPVSSLVALLEGGYAVEVVAADGSTSYVGVELGLFQSGWVEVKSGNVHEGDKVLVP
jgi:peptidoglycan hydrolase-like protein with peptidoglycan-binding domain